MQEALCGEYSYRTRIMSTNIPTHAKFADRIIVLEEGRIIYDGTYDAAQHLEIFQDLEDEASDSETTTQNENEPLPLNPFTAGDQQQSTI